MKNNLKIIVGIVGAVILAAAFPLLVWKLTARTGVEGSAGKSAGHYLTRKQLTFVGYATPEDTFQSVAWAMMNGDADKVFACLSPESQAYFNNKPNGRREFNANMKRNGQQFKGLQITAWKTLAEDKVELKFKLDPASQPKNGDHIPDFLVQAFVKIGGEWKLSGPTKEYTPDWDNGSQPEPAAP